MVVLARLSASAMVKGLGVVSLGVSIVEEVKPHLRSVNGVNAHRKAWASIQSDHHQG